MCTNTHVIELQSDSFLTGVLLLVHGISLLVHGGSFPVF